MQQGLFKGQLRNIIPIILGTTLYSFGLNYFIIPNQLMEGGLTGISLLLNYILHIPPSLTTLVMNVPLFFLGWKALGRESMFFTILGTLSLSFTLWLMETLIHQGWIVPFSTDKDFFLVTLYAGVTMGGGLGIVFRFGGTTGGVDIIARLGSKLRGWSMGQVILLIDIVVISASLLYIPKDKILYTLVAVFVASKTIDFITEGAYSAKAFTIVTDHPDEISLLIAEELDHGVTLFPAKGGFSKSGKDVVYCIVYRHEVRLLKQIIRSVDVRAFIVINDVYDVLGEGFRSE